VVSSTSSCWLSHGVSFGQIAFGVFTPKTAVSGWETSAKTTCIDLWPMAGNYQIWNTMGKPVNIGLVSSLTFQDLICGRFAFARIFY